MQPGFIRPSYEEQVKLQRRPPCAEPTGERVVSEGSCVLRLSWEGFAALCRDLAERVAADYWPDLVVGIARGGTLPGALIALLLRRDFHPLRVPLAGLPPDLPAYLPDRKLIAGRRVLLVDERAPDDAALRWAVDALRRLGAREIRTVLLFGGGGASADYSGLQADVLVLQPWIPDVVMGLNPTR